MMLSLLLLFVGLSWQKDPLNDFCRRFGHQSAVIDEKLYLDGGAVNWNPISQNPNNITNSWLLYNDLTTSPVSAGVPQLYANLSKNASMPDVQGGILWADDVNKRFYLYGGDHFNGDTPSSPNLISYDVIYDQWESFGSTGTGIGSVAWGGGVGIPSIGQGYMYGGWLSNNSMPGWNGDPQATSYLVKYQMDSGVWSNNTGPDSTPRAEGVMVYLPASSMGLLVYFGGLEQPFGNSTTRSSSMNNIYIYDIASSKWYLQKADGDTPADRRRFCAGAAWTPDRSSYNIYLYGGLGFGANATGFDDVYILSLPSFKWIKWWEGSDGGKPHHSLTCNVVNEGQMLIIGGSFPRSNDCDSPPTWGTHNLDLGKQSGKQWVEYQLNITTYVVPSEVVAVVGGYSSGGATATAPSRGYLNQDLGVYFEQHATVASRSPTRTIPSPTSTPSPTNTPPPPPPSKKKLSTGAIVGIAIAGAVVILALLLWLFCFVRRDRQQHPPPTPTTQNGSFAYFPQSPHSQHSQITEPQQLQANSVPAELATNEPYYQNGSKAAMMHQVHDQDHPVYQNTRWVEITPPSPSPITTSPRSGSYPRSYSPVTDTHFTDTQSPTHSPVHSPVHSYSSTGRSSTRRVPSHNNTYYSA